jgi:hypothetical protein
MNTELQTFESRVKEKLKDTIADLIPEKDLNKLVAASLESFKNKDLPDLIKKELNAHFTELIRKEFAKPEYAGNFNQQTQTFTSEAVKKLITENANLILANIISGAAYVAVQQMQNNIPRY